MSQLDRLNAALKNRPSDPFLHYAIAMEHLKLGENEIALEKFQALMHSQPDYVATYMQCGLLLADMQQIEFAQKTLLTGIQVAKERGDLHAASEMTELLDRLE